MTNISESRVVTPGRSEPAVGLGQGRNKTKPKEIEVEPSLQTPGCVDGVAVSRLKKFQGSLEGLWVRLSDEEKAESVLVPFFFVP